NEVPQLRPILELALAKTPAPKCGRHLVPLQDSTLPAVFNATIKTDQGETRFEPLETLYRIRSCFAYGTNRKNCNLLTYPASKCRRFFISFLPHRAAGACDESPSHPDRPWPGPASWLRHKAAPGRSGSGVFRDRRLPLHHFHGHAPAANQGRGSRSAG